MMQYTNEGRTTVFWDEEHVGIPAIANRPYVLVVDDDPAITSVVMLTLEMEDYAGLSISDGQQVLPFLYQIEADATRYMPAVILLDLMMPGLSGYEVAAMLAQHPGFACIPIIIMTADYRVRTASAVPGATDLLSKPFPVSALLTKLEPYLSCVPCT
jgi:two-component system sensor histidine kinase ChiS